MPESSPAELRRQAGGGTPGYSQERYRLLLVAHGHLVPLAPGETAEPLPCGWPDHRCPTVEAVARFAVALGQEVADCG